MASHTAAIKGNISYQSIPFLFKLNFHPLWLYLYFKPFQQQNNYLWFGI